MKKILITGSNGLLGQKIVYALLKRKDVEIIATSSGENRLMEKSGYKYESLDISKKEEVEAVLKKHKPDVVINTAAMTNVDACESRKEECFAINVKGVQNFVDVIEGNFKTDLHFIHLSTDFVFDGEKGAAYVETDEPNPLSYYAYSKHESEKVLQQSEVKWAIARTIIVYGIVDNMSRSNIVLWAKDALSKGQKINVVDDQFRAPTLAEDLADGCILIADKGATGIYHLSGPETYSVLDLVYKVADFWKLDKSLITPSKSNTLNQAAKRPPRTGFVIDKARKDLGYNPHSFEEGLKILNAQLK
ncbi:MAG: dTDP-4-dehydrorhamnose reductase [Bacteroidota bacterium]|jgi:dTDP-4-dehydrorhamnose reductase|nr:dTDP-4-dehydrorhamnose reductase [Bacteroidota bacterium]